MCRPPRDHPVSDLVCRIEELIPVDGTCSELRASGAVKSGGSRGEEDTVDHHPFLRVPTMLSATPSVSRPCVPVRGTSSTRVLKSLHLELLNRRCWLNLALLAVCKSSTESARGPSSAQSRGLSVNKVSVKLSPFMIPRQSLLPDVKFRD
ncbi:hypothetical protein PoB_006302700 [Plakobranchus ocellatus]|uniref:Uncharacterized protein n=1 Tax=Plakobranchus ocellatus TaxID=259542 RepID=A0AAV4CX84_9GAST|nr:hypothetical protein PoB_006302700 [Plakobranchus ocellatus]